MALGLNVQWGYAGLFNAGLMGFAALGGLTAVLVSVHPVPEAWEAGGSGIAASAIILVLMGVLIYGIRCWIRKGLRRWFVAPVLVVGYVLARIFYEPAASAIEFANPTVTGFLGGLGLPILISWVLGGFVAAGVAWFIGRVALGLREDYLAIATLGISEIIIATLKNEDWLTRGVKNVTGLPRPVPYELNLQQSPFVIPSSFGSWSSLAGQETTRAPYSEPSLPGSCGCSPSPSPTGYWTC